MQGKEEEKENINPKVPLQLGKVWLVKPKYDSTDVIEKFLDSNSVVKKGESTTPLLIKVVTVSGMVMLRRLSTLWIGRALMTFSNQGFLSEEKEAL